MTDLITMEHAYFPNNIKTHLYENFNIGSIDLVSVPVYNELKTDYGLLSGLKMAVDAEYQGIVSDQQYQIGQNKTAADSKIANLNTVATSRENAAITTHNTSVNTVNTQYDDIVKAKANLQKKFDELNSEVRRQVAEITELVTRLMKIKTDKDEAVRIVRAEIAKVKKAYEEELARLNAQQDLLNEEIKKYNEYQTTLAAGQQKFIKLDARFQDQLSKVTELNRLIDNLAKSKVVLDSEYAVWESKFAALENDFKKIEEQISKYLKKGETDLEYINSLLKEKRLLQDKLFAYSEDKYNTQTHLIDDVNLELSPSKLLTSNQRREIAKNESKYGKLRNDIMSISKNIQINKNEYRKKSFYIFLLTNAFVFLIVTLIIVILMRRDFI